ncbi:hypothetical protein K3495_g3930 [Podosphaera aphanis]|nr:hypothetical protein K3495_g3930 [Podosphaera aphanis]
MLAVSEVVRLCPSCQLMKRPDPSLPNLMPIIPPQPLTRWAIDHTGPGGPGGHILLYAVEYATGWLVSRVVRTTGFEYVGPLFEYIENTFGRPRKYVSDNHNAFVGKAALE